MIRKIKTMSFYQWCNNNDKKDILEEWDYSKNNIAPADVSFASHKEVWWKCSKCGNEWKATIKNRKSGTGCKKCSFKTISYKLSKRDIDDSFKTKFPKIAKEWDYSRNNIKPNEIAPYSEKKVWWICPKGHNYKQTIYSRTSKNNNCPYCSGHKVLNGFNDLATLKPNLAKEWNYKKNGELKPTEVTSNSNKKVWWKCSKGHEWYASINNRNHLNRGCPYCSGNKPIIGKNDLKTINPRLAKEWNYEKNGKLMPYDVSSNSNKKVWWVCSKGHEWRTSITNRNHRGDNCPYCSNQKVLPGYNDLFTTNPELKKEWDFKRNSISPNNYTGGSGTRAWWVCSKGHSYSALIHNKSRGFGCPYCANQKLLKGYNDLETTNPRLSKEWDYEKNGELKPSDVIAGSNTKVWWICKNRHHYKAAIVARNRGTNCPICNKHKKSSFPEQAIFFYIKKEYNDAINGYKNNKILGSHMEFDIYIPSISTAIEYDGMIFHDEKRLSNDIKKYNCCKEKNIKLIRVVERKQKEKTSDVVFETEPNNNLELNKTIEKLINYLCGVNSNVNIERDKNEILSLLEKRKVNLVDKYSNIAKEWDYKKNYPLVPENVSPNTNLRVWWKCSKGHEWQSTVVYRTSKNSECPFCLSYKLPRYAKETLQDFRPDVAKVWDYEKNKPFIPSSVAGKSKFEYWFKCKNCNSSWKEPIKNITKRKYICPKCKDKSYPK